jgi:hypothetical protein
MSCRHCQLPGPAARLVRQEGAPARGGAASAAPRGGKTQRQDAADCCAASASRKLLALRVLVIPANAAVLTKRQATELTKSSALTSRPAIERLGERRRLRAWSGPARGRSVFFLAGGELRCLACSNSPSQNKS